MGAMYTVIMFFGLVLLLLLTSFYLFQAVGYEIPTNTEFLNSIGFLHLTNEIIAVP